MYCKACGSEVTGEFGFCPVCGAALDPSAAPEASEMPAYAETKPFGITHVAVIILGLVAGFAVTYFFGWSLFILIPILFFGTGSGELRRILNYFALGMLAGLCLGIFLRSTHFNIF